MAILITTIILLLVATVAGLGLLLYQTVNRRNQTTLFKASLKAFTRSLSQKFS